MTKSEGLCKIDGVLLGELKVSFLGQSVVMEATYALCNYDSGERYGRGTRNQAWSEDTMNKLRELMEAIEKDVCSDMFDGDTTVSGGEPPSATSTDGVASL